MLQELPFELLAFGVQPAPARATLLAELMESNLNHPARELMWGSPGCLLASALLHAHTDDEPWADLFRASAVRLWTQLLWFDEHQCHHWIQDLYGR